MIGFRVNVDQFKAGFFDRPVMARVPAAERKALSRFGAHVRTRARTSIRKRKGTSAPGSPPYSHGRHLLRSFILFAYDKDTRSVVIGPAKLNAQVGNAPEALEKGGMSEMLGGSRRRGTLRRQKIQIAPRPYMQPAFEAELPNAAKQFKDTISK